MKGSGDWHQDYEVRQITAYISVYNVTRQYGGPEEGGWWYDAYEWLKVSIPFRAVQDFRWELSEEDSECPRVARRMECPECGYPYSEALFPLDLTIHHGTSEHRWVPYGPPRPADFQAEIQVMAHHCNLHTFFGPETSGRGSVLSDGDITIIVERNPGEREHWPRPRYE